MVKKRVASPVDTKNIAVEMKLQGYTTKQVMQELNIKNETQVETWFRWYKNGETHRFHQQVGKQYSYEKGMAELSEIDQLKLELKIDLDEVPLNQLFSLIQNNPGLLRRPIMLDEKRFQVGYNEDEIRRFLPREVRAYELDMAQRLVNF